MWIIKFDLNWRTFVWQFLFNVMKTKVNVMYDYIILQIVWWVHHVRSIKSLKKSVILMKHFKYILFGLAQIANSLTVTPHFNENALHSRKCFQANLSVISALATDQYLLPTWLHPWVWFVQYFNFYWIFLVCGWFHKLKG